MVSLNTLKPAAGAIKKRKRIGRGNASGTGTTAGRGHKGQKSRNGSHLPYVGFEGGQNPIYKRTPKLKGFHNFNKKIYAEVSVGDLGSNYVAGDTVTLANLKEKKIVKKKHNAYKVLGTGEITVALTIDTDKLTGTAKQKIEKAGGSISIATVAPKVKK